MNPFKRFDLDVIQLTLESIYPKEWFQGELYPNFLSGKIVLSMSVFLNDLDSITKLPKRTPLQRFDEVHIAAKKLSNVLSQLIDDPYTKELLQESEYAYAVWEDNGLKSYIASHCTTCNYRPYDWPPDFIADPDIDGFEFPSDFFDNPELRVNCLCDLPCDKFPDLESLEFSKPKWGEIHKSVSMSNHHYIGELEEDLDILFKIMSTAKECIPLKKGRRVDYPSLQFIFRVDRWLKYVFKEKHVFSRSERSRFVRLVEKLFIIMDIEMTPAAIQSKIRQLKNQVEGNN